VGLPKRGFAYFAAKKGCIRPGEKARSQGNTRFRPKIGQGGGGEGMSGAKAGQKTKKGEGHPSFQGGDEEIESRVSGGKRLYGRRFGGRERVMLVVEFVSKKKKCFWRGKAINDPRREISCGREAWLTEKKLKRLKKRLWVQPKKSGDVVLGKIRPAKKGYRNSFPNKEGVFWLRGRSFHQKEGSLARKKGVGIYGSRGEGA